MINEDRFWEASIAEAVRNETAPDVTAKVLAELADKQPETPRQRGRVRFLRWGLELAAAAVVVVAIGLATGIIRLPGGDESIPLPPRQFAAAPGTEYERNDDVLELKHGWLLVTTGAPTVTCDGSELSKVDGRVLIHAGSMPPGERPESVEKWLQANNVETDMVNNIKHWVKGVGLAALVLSGTAMLDGQEIKAPEPQPQSTSEWHVIRSVMDIDNLPKGVKYVNADGVSAAHLDFLADVESLEAISIRNGRGIRPDHLKSLQALKNLKWLDIRGATWEPQSREEFNPASDLSLVSLTEMSTLERLGVDLIPKVEGVSFDYEWRDVILPTLKLLAAKNVEIELGYWNPDSLGTVSFVLEAIPTLRGIEIGSPTQGEIKLLAAHANLREITLSDYYAGEIGLAYLARNADLHELSLYSGGISLDEIHQISRTKLRFLRLDAELSSSADQCFEKLAGMELLRELELRNLWLREASWPAFTKFTSRKPLDSLRVEPSVMVDSYGGELLLAQHIPTRMLTLALEDQFTLPILENMPDFLCKGAAAKHLEVLRYELSDAAYSDDLSHSDFAEPFKSYPNLKRIEISRDGFQAPDMEDQFVRWLKTNLPNVEVVVTP